MAVERNIFHRGLTYDEWASQQDSTNLEFRAIHAYHKTHPGYDLDEIRNSIFLNVIEAEENQKICIESFGERHPNSKKLNEKISALINILFSHSSKEYKSVDKKGHGDQLSARFGGRGKDSQVIAFRIEEKAVRYAKYLIEHDMVPEVYTSSDLVRLSFAKYIEMIPIIHEFRDAVSDRFLLDVQSERNAQERAIVDEMLKGFDDNLKSIDKDLNDAMRHVNNKEELEEIGNMATKFIKDALSYNSPTKRENARVKDYIMMNPILYNILSTLEREKLVTREYIDSVRLKGEVIPLFSILENSDPSEQP